MHRSKICGAAAGLLAHDLDADYVSDVFVGSRKEGPEKSMAVDYIRHGIELSQLSGSEMAAQFNTELSRAVRYEPKRSEAAERLISMHKRHGEVVFRVLEDQIAEQAEKLVKGTMDDSSLLALVIGKKHLIQSQATEAKKEEHSMAAKGQGGKSADSMVRLQDAASVIMEQMMPSILAKFEASARQHSQKRGKLGRRDAVIFATIYWNLKGLNTVYSFKITGSCQSGQISAMRAIRRVTRPGTHGERRSRMRRRAPGCV